jgi:hypothetical protein
MGVSYIYNHITVGDGDESGSSSDADRKVISADAVGEGHENHDRK